MKKQFFRLQHVESSLHERQIQSILSKLGLEIKDLHSLTPLNIANYF